jgi:carbonic anhydrase/acetyltransferase-like protein (isoleucine patch superfamily)
MIFEHNGAVPNINPTARIAPAAVGCGEVTLGAHTSLGFGAVLNAESGPIDIGANCVIADTAVIRATRRQALGIGDNVLIGPRA